jgi:hypothetical protein
VNYQPRGTRLGWLVGEMLCLDPDAAFTAVADLARERGQAYPLTAKTLYRRLKESNVLARTAADRVTYPVTVDGIRRRVLHIPVTTVFPDADWYGGSVCDFGPVSNAVPVSCAGFPPSAGKPAQQNGPNSPRKTAFVPIVPVVPVSGAHAAHIANEPERKAADAVVGG